MILSPENYHRCRQGVPGGSPVCHGFGVPIDPLAQEGFTAARAYDLGRPSYAQAAIERLLVELELGRSSRVLDLAAGTGQL